MADGRFIKTIEDLRGMLDGSVVEHRSLSFDSTTSALHGGLARSSLYCAAAEILPGLALRQTYAHVFAPEMVAVSLPPHPQAPHPGPWHATFLSGS
jgi:hypothetical protein